MIATGLRGLRVDTSNNGKCVCMHDNPLTFGELLKMLEADIIPLFLTNLYRHHGDFMPYLMNKKKSFMEWQQVCFVFHKTEEGQEFWDKYFEKYTTTT